MQTCRRRMCTYVMSDKDKNVNGRKILVPESDMSIQMIIHKVRMVW